MTTSVIQREFGGFPFIDSTFLPGRLLTAAACCRWSIDHPDGIPPDPAKLAGLLEPVEAKRIRARQYTLDLPYGELTGEQQIQVSQVRHQIAELIPAWRPLVDLPLRFLELRHSQAVSSSNFAWPQHVFLGLRAFSGPASLAEQVLHETSHQWMYLMEEMFPMQADGTDRRFMLPSGTSDRSATELLGATHVVANLQRLWPLLPVGDAQRQARLDHLARYGAGCADLLVESAFDVLTEEGQTLATRLIEEIRNHEPAR